MKIITFHHIKYTIIKTIYFILAKFNLKKFFFENDFEQKKIKFHKIDEFEKKIISLMNKKFTDLENKKKINRISSELLQGKDFSKWYKDDMLYQISLKYLPTKRRHDYLKRYNYHFFPIRNDVKKILEIGVDRGESLSIWKEYFPNAEIIGLDIDPKCKEYETDRIKIVIGDQNNRDFLYDLSEKENGFDIIVDDGSHSHENIVNSFTSLFPYVRDKGYSVIEDVINNYKTTNFFMRYGFGINYYPTNKATVDEPGYSSIDISNCGDIKNTTSINLYRHIIFLRKGFNPEENPFKNIIEKKFIY